MGGGWNTKTSESFGEEQRRRSYPTQHEKVDQTWRPIVNRALRIVSSWRASDFQMGVLAVKLINHKILIDVVPTMSPYNRLGFILSRSC